MSRRLPKRSAKIRTKNEATDPSRATVKTRPHCPWLRPYCFWMTGATVARIAESKPSKNVADASIASSAQR